MRGQNPYQAVLVHCFPDLPVRSVVPILEGWDNVTLEVNGELIFRCALRPENEAQLEREVHLLPELAPVLPIPIPRFEFVSRDEQGRRVVGYRKIPGVPLSCALPDAARQMAEFLSTLHRFPVSRAVRMGVPRFTARQWWLHHRALVERVRERAFDRLDPAVRERTEFFWECLLGVMRRQRFRPVFIHGDLAGEHILCDPASGRITGVIDWGDVRIADPALDFAGLLADCGRDFAQRVLDDYEGDVDAHFLSRATFYVDFVPFYEVEYGLLTGQEDLVQHGLEMISGLTG